jgi:GT2 family glycosyltransferase
MGKRSTDKFSVPRHEATGGPPSRASIVTAADDHPPDLQLWFHSLNIQTLAADRYEVIVVDATHETDYQTALKSFRSAGEVRMDISCHRIGRGGRARALNYALGLAKGDVIIFLGEDFVVSPGFVEAHMSFHEANPEADAVGIGSSLLIPEVRTTFSVWLEESGQLFGVPFRADMTEVPEDFFYVGNASVKRELLTRAGRFDERYAYHAGDDFELGQRLRASGMTAHFVPGTSTHHVHSIGLGERERAMRRAGAAARIYMIDYPGDCAWVKTASAPSWLQWLRVTAARVYLAMARSDDALITWWKSRLDAAFSSGYKNGA